MVSRSARFDISELHSYIAHAMAVHLGPSAVSNNYNDVILMLVENAVYPYTDNDMGPINDLLIRRGISSDAAGEIMAVGCVMVNRMVGAFFQPYIGEFLFEVHYDGNGNVMVDAICPIPENTPDNDDHIHERFIRETTNSMDNGDWVSPKLRRLAGYA